MLGSDDLLKDHNSGEVLPGSLSPSNAPAVALIPILTVLESAMTIP